MKPGNKDQIPDALQEWRARTLDPLLSILAVAALPAWGNTVYSAIQLPEYRILSVFFSIIFASAIALAVLRQINSRVRAWGLIFLGCMVASINLWSGGPLSAGSWVAMALPVVAFILIGARAGIIVTIASVLEVVAATILHDRGIIEATVLQNEPSTGSLTTFLMILAVTMALLVLFYRFQVKTMEDQRRTAGELDESRSFLEEQNRTLEEQIARRTADLERSAQELKKSAAALQESHRQIAEIIDFLPEAVLVIDVDGRVVAWNHALEEMTGVPASQMLGKGDKDPYEYAVPFYGERRPILIDLVSLPEDEVKGKYREIHMEGKVLVGETYVPQLKGQEAYLIGIASVLRDSRGIITGAIEVIRDVTARRHVEEALQKSEQLYRSVIDSSPDTYFRLDGAGNLIMISPTGAKLQYGPAGLRP